MWRPPWTPSLPGETGTQLHSKPHSVRSHHVMVAAPTACLRLQGGSESLQDNPLYSCRGLHLASARCGIKCNVSFAEIPILICNFCKACQPFQSEPWAFKGKGWSYFWWSASPRTLQEEDNDDKAFLQVHDELPPCLYTGSQFAGLDDYVEMARAGPEAHDSQHIHDKVVFDGTSQVGRGDDCNYLSRLSWWSGRYKKWMYCKLALQQQLTTGCGQSNPSPPPPPTHTHILHHAWEDVSAVGTKGSADLTWVDEMPTQYLSKDSKRSLRTASHVQVHVPRPWHTCYRPTAQCSRTGSAGCGERSQGAGGGGPCSWRRWPRGCRLGAHPGVGTTWTLFCLRTSRRYNLS